MSIESTKRFSNDIAKLIDYYSREFEITYAEVIGVLQMTIMDIHLDSSMPEGEDCDGADFKEKD